MRLQTRLFKLLAFVLLTIVIIGLNVILLKSSLDLIIHTTYYQIWYYVTYLGIHILEVFGATIVEVALLWLLLILNRLSIRSGLIITLVMLIFSGIFILVPASLR